MARPSITIHPPREEEIVIEAGLPPRDDEAGQSSEVARDGAEATVEREVSAASVAGDGFDEDAGGPSAKDGEADAASQVAKAVKTAKAAKAAKTAKPAQTAKAAKTDDYHETTLEDLRSSTMSTTQKIVIVCAVVGIIVFVIWYLLNYVFI